MLYMNIFNHILPVMALAALCAGWVAVQLLARRMGTKNHMDEGSASCGKCGCGEGECSRSDVRKARGVASGE
jgi:hypothetical protein